MRHMPVVAQMRDIIERGTIGDGQGRLVPALRRQRRRLLLQGLACRPGQHHGSAAAEGRSRYRRHPLARRRIHRPGAGDGRPAVYGGIADRRDNADRAMGDWFSLDNWPPARARPTSNPVIDVEDISMMTMRLDNGVLASYQQCHFTPGLLAELHGDRHRGPDRELRRRARRPDPRLDHTACGYAEPDQKVEISDGEGGHGGADPTLIAEFLRFARRGEPQRRRRSQRGRPSPRDARHQIAARRRLCPRYSSVARRARGVLRCPPAGPGPGL